MLAFTLYNETLDQCTGIEIKKALPGLTGNATVTVMLSSALRT